MQFNNKNYCNNYQNNNCFFYKLLNIESFLSNLRKLSLLKKCIKIKNNNNF